MLLQTTAIVSQLSELVIFFFFSFSFTFSFTFSDSLSFSCSFSAPLFGLQLETKDEETVKAVLRIYCLFLLSPDSFTTLSSTKEFLLNVLRCTSFHDADIISLALSCLVSFSRSKDPEILEVFSRSQLGRRLSVVITAPERAREVLAERGFVFSPTNEEREQVFPKAIAILANISPLKEIQKQLLTTDVDSLVFSLLQAVLLLFSPSLSSLFGLNNNNNNKKHTKQQTLSCSTEVLFGIARILTNVLVTEDVVRVCSSHPQIIPCLTQCFKQANRLELEDIVIDFVTALTVSEKGRLLVAQSEETLRGLIALFISDKEYGSRNSPAVPLLHLCRCQLVFGMLVKDSAFLTKLSTWISRSGISQAHGVQLLTVLVEDLDEAGLRLCMQENGAAQLCKLALTADNSLVPSITKILSVLVMLPEYKEVIVASGEPLWQRLAVFLSKPNTKTTVRASLQILAEVFAEVTFSDRGLSLALESLRMLSSKDTDIVQPGALLLSRILAQGVVLLDYDELVASLLQVFRTADMLTLRYTSQSLAHISVAQAGNHALASSPELLGVARRVLCSTTDQETLRAILILLTNISGNPAVQEGLGNSQDNKMAGRLLDLLSNASPTLRSSATKLLVSFSSGKPGLLSVISHPLATNQIATLVRIRSLSSLSRDLLFMPFLIGFGAAWEHGCRAADPLFDRSLPDCGGGCLCGGQDREKSPEASVPPAQVKQARKRSAGFQNHRLRRCGEHLP